MVNGKTEKAALEQRIYDRCLVRVGQLEGENAKLRELVKDMWANQEALPYGLYIEIRDRMRELRVVR